MCRVAILIVTYNSEAEIGGCLDALRGLRDVEIVVIDNASSDATLRVTDERGIRRIANASNAGFAAAVNQGVRATAAELLLVLNPDAYLRTGLEALVAAFDDQSVGAAGGLLAGEDGHPQVGFMVRRLPSPAALAFEALGINRVFPRNPVNWNYRCFDLDLTHPSDVEQPAGGFLMFSRAAFENAGGFDEQFWPIWFEDVDFCARLARLGYRIRFVPECAANHAGAHSIRALSLGKRETYWYGSLLKYAAKYYRPIEFRSICAAVAIGSVLRSLWTVKRQGLSGIAVHSAVVRQAVRRMFGSMR